MFIVGTDQILWLPPVSEQHNKDSATNVVNIPATIKGLISSLSFQAGVKKKKAVSRIYNLLWLQQLAQLPYFWFKR